MPFLGYADDILLFEGDKPIHRYTLEITRTNNTDSCKLVAETLFDIKLGASKDKITILRERFNSSLFRNGVLSLSDSENKPKTFVIDREISNIKSLGIGEKESYILYFTAVLPFTIPVGNNKETWDSEIIFENIPLKCSNVITQISEKLLTVNTIGEYDYADNRERIQLGKVSFESIVEIDYVKKIIISASYTYKHVKKGVMENIAEFSLIRK